MIKNCQVCGAPLFSTNDMGQTKKGYINKDYCTSCYQEGEFTRVDRNDLHNDFVNENSNIIISSMSRGIINMR